MTSRNRVKAIGGLAALLVFLGLVVLDTVDPNITLSIEDKIVLLSLIASLLGLERLMESLPSLSWETQDDE
ncbi:hypothetical protein [Haloparvum sedimenti]|uniref:hypothetical protein n=1 Tax=Haloparvum sedimenti TaxID=1678448 RepID=UPI00071E82E7|nr:hypothetical protein [Haloparvum sedimenti]